MQVEEYGDGMAFFEMASEDNKVYGINKKCVE
jgi:hypothetical protein